MMARVLSEAGYRVLQAGDGAEALEVFAEQGGIDLVVTDIEMPRMNGLKLAAELSAIAQVRVPILFVSAYTYTASEIPGPVLSKPFTAETLVGEVQELLRRHYEREDR